MTFSTAEAVRYQGGLSTRSIVLAAALFQLGAVATVAPAETYLRVQNGDRVRATLGAAA